MKNIFLIDVTNRDGVQTSRILLSKLAKTMLNIYLDEMGVFQSEIGSPTLKHEMNYIKRQDGFSNSSQTCIHRSLFLMTN